MGDKKDNFMSFHNQVVRYDPSGHEVSPMEQMKLTLASGDTNNLFLAESSRKRKASDIDRGSNISNGVSSLYSGNLRNLPWEASSQHDPGAFQVMSMQGSTQEMLINQIQFARQNNASSQYANYQFCDMNKFPMGFQTKDVNYQRTSVENLKSCTFSDRVHSSIDKTSVAEIPKLFDSQHFSYGAAASQVEMGKFQLCSSNSGSCTEMVQADLSSIDGIKLGHGNHILPSNSSLNPSTTAFDCLTSSEFSNLAHHENLDASMNVLDMLNTGPAIEVAKSGESMDVAGARDTASVTTGSAQTSAVAERKEAYGSYQYPKTKTRSSSSPQVNNLGANLHARDEEWHGSVMLEKSLDCKEVSLEHTRFNSGTLVSGDNGTKSLENPVASDPENGNPMLRVETSPKNTDNLVEPGDSQPSLDLDGRSKSLAGKVASTVTEKLWDGTLQLNSSTTVSAIAFFKSGEKAPEIHWSKHVEVKGKVRLEAFEKFIQELPRSRSRALMVISLCWNAESSKTGLLGMKEVTKGYKEGERVGYAQLCPGIDLYVCPRSDTIITILAKYGFFKGMAAVEEDQDSLIGCVVWRRNCPSSNFVPKKSERKKNTLLEQVFDSPPGSAVSQNAEMNSPLANTQDSDCNQTMQCMREPAGVSSPLIFDTKSTALEGAISTTESKNIPSGNNLFNTYNAPTNTVPVLAVSIQHNPTAIPVQLPSSQEPDSSSHQDPVKCKSNSEIPIICNSEPKMPGMSFEPSRPTLSGSPIMLPEAQQNSADPDDDDLPEFDFGSACGIQQPPESRFPWSSQKAHFADDPLSNKLPVEESKDTGVSMPPAPPILRPMAVTQRPHTSSFLVHALNIHDRITQSKAVGEISSEGKQAAQTIEPSSGLGTIEMGKDSLCMGTKSNFPRKSLWDDDDDDMPEWCPPPPLPPPPPLLPLPPPPLPPPPPPPLLPLPPPPLLPLPPPPPTTYSRPQIPSPIFKPTLGTVPSWTPAPFQSQTNIHPPYNQGFFHGYQPGFMLPEQTRPVAGLVQSSPRHPSELKPDQTTRRRTTGWDVKPSSQLNQEGTRHRNTGRDVKPVPPNVGWRGQRR